MSAITSVPDPSGPDAPARPTALEPSGSQSHHDGVPVRLLTDRVLVRVSEEDGERRSTGGILIPATAQVGRRLAWAGVVAVGQNVRSVEVGDRVLFDPEDKSEVELHGVAYILMRERDLHAVASPRVEGGSTGLYL